MSTIVTEPIEKSKPGFDIDQPVSDVPPPGLTLPPDDNGDDDSGNSSERSNNNAFIGMLLFLGADFMFFCGLIGSFIVFRFGTENWPPPDQPLLPVGITGLNTLILLFSGWTMYKSWRYAGSSDTSTVVKYLLLTGTAGSVFLLVQGFEWVRLINFGLYLSGNVYGATFYVIIGCHALHVLGAVIWMLIGIARGWRDNEYLATNHGQPVKLIGMYWFLVVGLWPALYGLVYLN